MACWAQRVTKDRVVDIWPHCVEHAANALEYAGGEIELHDVLRLLLSGEWHLWIVMDKQAKTVVASAVTEIVHYPQLKALRCVLLGGKDMQHWLSLISEAWEPYARRQGCSRIEGVGRKGWVKAAKKLGYIEAHTVIIKELRSVGIPTERCKNG